MSRWKLVPASTIVSVPLVTPRGATWASIPPSIGFFLLTSSTTRCHATSSSDDASGAAAGAGRSTAGARSTGGGDTRGGADSARPPPGRDDSNGRVATGRGSSPSRLPWVLTGAGAVAPPPWRSRCAASSTRLSTSSSAGGAGRRVARTVAISSSTRGGERAHLGRRGGAEQARGGVRLEAVVAIGDSGVEQRQGIAQRALRRAHDRGQRRPLEGDLLLGEDVLERGRERVQRDRAEVEALHAREHRGRDVARIGGGQHEDHVRGRLLQRLEQRVERRLGELVDLVDDVDLVAAARRRVLDVLPEGADLLDAAVGGAVDLDHVHRDVGVAAHRARAARLGALALGTQQRLREQPRRGGLADAARAGEEVGVRHAPGRQRVAQRPRDGVLSDDRFERLRPPLAGEDLIAHVAIKVTVHPPSNDPYCELPRKPAPVRYSHGTREGRLTVAPFRVWRGSVILVAWGPTFNAAP